MDKELSQWYSIASLSPNPEMNERYAFGIVICDGKNIKLHVTRDIEKKFNFISKNLRFAFKHLVSSFESELKAPEMFDSISRTYEPQLIFNKKTPIYVQLDKHVKENLIKSLFHVGEVPKESEISALALSKNKDFEKTLMNIFPSFGVKLKRKVSPNKLGYSLREQNDLDNHAEVDFAMSGLNRDLLVSKIDLKTMDEENTIHEQSISKNTIRISKSFWFWKNHKEELQKRAKKEFRTVGIILNGVHGEELKEWGNYIQHIWAQDCDKVLMIHQEKVSEALSNDVEWLVK